MTTPIGQAPSFEVGGHPLGAMQNAQVSHYLPIQYGSSTLSVFSKSFVAGSFSASNSPQLKYVQEPLLRTPV